MRTKVAITVCALGVLVTAIALAASLEKARLLHANGLFREAKLELVELVSDKSSPERAACLLLLGQIALEEGKDELAAETWAQVLREFPESPEAIDARDRIADQRVKLPAKRPSFSRIHLTSAGAEPRRLLTVATRVGAVEEMTVSLAFFGGECILPEPPPRDPMGDSRAVHRQTVTRELGRGEYEATAVLEFIGGTEFGGSGSIPLGAEIVDVFRFNTLRDSTTSSFAKGMGFPVPSTSTSSGVPSVAVGSGATWETATTFKGVIPGSANHELQTQTKHFLMELSETGFRVLALSELANHRVTIEGRDTLIGFRNQTETRMRFDRLSPIFRKSSTTLSLTLLKGTRKQKSSRSICFLIEEESRSRLP